MLVIVTSEVDCEKNTAMIPDISLSCFQGIMCITSHQTNKFLSTG